MTQLSDLIKSTGEEKFLQIGEVLGGLGLDAFNRKRVSTPDSFFDDKHLYGLNPYAWMYEDTGSASHAYDSDSSTVDLTVTSASGDKCIKQSRRPIPYIPGHSNLMEITFVLGDSVANQTRKAGLFDSNNGLFLYSTNGVTGVCVRSDSSGVVVDTAIPQSDWNEDKMDGTGDSGITLDLTKSQILIIDFQWLSVGTVRFGFSINGVIYYCHKQHHANLETTSYMSTPTLPIRYEIENTGAASGGTLKAICGALMSEGGFSPSGLVFLEGNGATPITSITTRKALFAIRLKDTFNSKPNRVVASLDKVHTYVEDKACFIEVVKIVDPTSVTDNFSDVKTGYSACEYTVNPIFSGGTEHRVVAEYLPAAKNGDIGVGGSERSGQRDHFKHISQNIASDSSELFVAYATSFSTAAQASITLEWQEIQ